MSPYEISRPNRERAVYLVLLTVGLLVPFQNFLYVMFVMKVLCFALFASAFNLLFGFAGLLSFGHAAFFGGAAYVTAYACKEWGLTPELGLLVGVAVSSVLGYLIGALAIRRQGIYFAMITLALAQMVFFLAVQMPFTKGEDGLQAPRGKAFGLVDLSSDTAMYYFVFAIFVAAFILVRRIVYSPFGEVLKAIRENEPRAISLGYDVDRFKLLAFVISASLAGLAGSLKALVFQLATLADVHFLTSGEVVVMALLGGIGTILGPLAGAALVVALQNYLAGVGSWSTIATGIVFIVCVLSFRRGIVGEILAWSRRVKPNGNLSATTPAAKNHAG